MAIVTVLALALSLYLRLRTETVASGRMPLWDMAAHAVDGIRLAEHARQAHSTAFILEINRMSLWPPVFPLLSFPVFLLFGYDYQVANSWMNALSFLSLLACFLVESLSAGSVGPSPERSRQRSWR